VEPHLHSRLAIFLRLVKLLAICFKHGIGFLLYDRKAGGPDRLKRFFEDAGGTFLKFGQILSLQPDLIPRDYCNALFDLLDSVPPFEFEKVESTFQEDLGRKPSEIFDFFEPTPFASASIGQVHEAWLDGRKLAVKVRRPDAPKVFAADLQLMRAVADTIERFHLNRLFWLVRAIHEFTAWTREELDYRFEARFMEALAFNAVDSSRETVPRVIKRWSTKRILVADYLEGPTVLDYIRAIERGDESFEDVLRPLGFDAETFAGNIVENFVSDAFHNGIFHADLHPANLLVQPANVVGYVDFGITGTLSHYSRRNMVALTLALTQADPDAMMVYFLKIATLDKDSDATAFKKGLQELVNKWYRGDEKRLRESFTNVFVDMLHLSRRTGVWPSRDVTRYIRSVITADGLINRFASNLDIGRNLEQICESYLKRQMWELWLSPENFADLTSAGVRLLAEGPTTMTSFLRQISEDRYSPEDDGHETRDKKHLVERARQLALVVVTAAALLGFSDGPAQLGMNLFTAEMLFTFAGAMMLFLTIRRLV
jgi:ubiquinone biosynthesis protein